MKSTLRVKSKATTTAKQTQSSTCRKCVKKTISRHQYILNLRFVFILGAHGWPKFKSKRRQDQPNQKCQFGSSIFVLWTALVEPSAKMVHAETFNGAGRVVDKNNNREVFLEAFGKENFKVFVVFSQKLLKKQKKKHFNRLQETKPLSLSTFHYFYHVLNLNIERQSLCFYSQKLLKISKENIWKLKMTNKWQKSKVLQVELQVEESRFCADIEIINVLKKKISCFRMFVVCFFVH